MPDPTSTPAPTPTPQAAPTPDPKPAPSPQAAPTPTPTPEPAPTPAQDWREEMAGGDAQVKKFLEQYPSQKDAGKALLGFRQKLSTAITPPGDNATPEEIAEYRKRVGVPEKEDGYTFEAPEGFEEPDPEKAGAVAKRFMAVAHKHNIPAAAFADLVGAAYDLVKGHGADTAKATETSVKAAQDALRGEWKGDFDKNVAFATSAYGSFGDAEFKQLAESIEVAPGVKLGNHPAMLRVFAKIGRATGEERLEFLAMDDKQRNTAQSDYDRLTAEYNEAQRVGDDAKAQRLFAERAALSKTLHGTAPADGRR